MNTKEEEKIPNFVAVEMLFHFVYCDGCTNRLHSLDGLSSVAENVATTYLITYNLITRNHKVTDRGMFLIHMIRNTPLPEATWRDPRLA